MTARTPEVIKAKDQVVLNLPVKTVDGERYYYLESSLAFGARTGEWLREREVQYLETAANDRINDFAYYCNRYLAGQCSLQQLVGRRRYNTNFSHDYDHWVWRALCVGDLRDRVRAEIWRLYDETIKLKEERRQQNEQ